MKYDIIVVGGGHAGIEAALAAAKFNKHVALLTLSKDFIGSMPCNPSIGGPAKGVIVREIDALGGMMGIATDATALQIKMLNTAKGPGVRCLRAQSDKIAYMKYMQNAIEMNKNIDVYESMVTSLIIEDGMCFGVYDDRKNEIRSNAVILTTGTYLESDILIGHDKYKSGPDNQKWASGLSKNLSDLGFTLMRLKTGTPPRILESSIDFSDLQIEYGSDMKLAFSHQTKEFLNFDEQIVCHLIHTTPLTHQIIHDNLTKSAMYGGQVKGIGPRYCPSIEDKIVRFADKPRHQLFLEPESKQLDTIYLQGFSTSMPKDIQEKMIKSLPGLANAIVVKYAYAIEYDAIDPLQLKPSLETKLIRNLFCAGQINGTSGYEEAAAQGLMAGINAVRILERMPPIILRRDQAYIGVLIDDLVTKGTKEPYRLLTSRAEFRLLLRHDNADERLRKIGYDIGLVNDQVYSEFLIKMANIDKIINSLKETRFTPKSSINEILENKLEYGISGYELLARPNISLKMLMPYLPLENYSAEVIDSAEIKVKYLGYIKKEIEEANRLKSMEDVNIEDIDYSQIGHLANEARQKLIKIRPLTIGQASRISGVNSVDISSILIYLKQNKKI